MIVTQQDKPRPVLRLKRPRRADKAQDPSTALLKELRAQAPEVWDPERPLPLAVGMHLQLFPLAERHEMSRSAVRRFLTAWTSNEAYLMALAEDESKRYDADGKPAGEVRERDRSRARLRLERKRSAKSA